MKILDEYSLIINGTIITPYEYAQAPVIKDNLNKCLIIEKGAIAFTDKILMIDKIDNVLTKYPISGAKTIFNARGKTVIPGFVDSHTHLSFAGTREFELDWKLNGLSYNQIAAKGGGILSTMKYTREKSIDEIKKSTHLYLNQMLLHGTTSIEAKSGYGLETTTELKQLQILKELHNEQPIDITPTFLGAHAIPPDVSSELYTQLLIEEMIPAVNKQGIAKFIDVFCDQGYFTIKQTEKILKTGIENGLKPKIHADEIAKGFGGAELAAELNATSADHLLQISPQGIKHLAEKDIIGTLLPGTPFTLRMKEYPPAREMINAGVPIALATDFNPNCMLISMQMVMMLSNYQMAIRPIESLNAATINGAWAINKPKICGSLSIGKNADIVILDIPNIYFIGYHLGQNHVVDVFKDGKRIVKNRKLLKNSWKCTKEAL